MISRRPELEAELVSDGSCGMLPAYRTSIPTIHMLTSVYSDGYVVRLLIDHYSVHRAQHVG
jgi:hypothetical protein